MESFLDRYYIELDDNLNDPNTSKRLTKTKKFKILRFIERRIWERLLSATGQESMLGYSEATITLETDKEFYLLPGNFRQFLGFEHRLAGNPNRLLSKMPSVSHYDPGVGVEILEGRRGFRLHPRPILSGNQDWVLKYIKGPVVLHHSVAKEIGDSWLKGDQPGTDAGELVRIDDYYNGAILRVYDSTTGSPQSREIIDYDSGEAVFQFRHEWNPRPTGIISYEISPTLPEDYDSLYALDAAIFVLGRRNLESRKALLGERNELWEACRSFFQSNVADRGPTRTKPVPLDLPDTGYDPSWL